MMKRKIIIYATYYKDNFFENDKYKLPIGCGGMEKNIVSNIDILKEEYDVYLIIFGLRDITECKEQGFHIIPAKPLLKWLTGIKYLSSIVLAINLLKQKPFGIKLEKREDVIVMVHNDFVKTSLTKLLRSKFKVVLSLHSRFKNLIWNPNYNILLRVLYFFLSLITLFLADKLIVNNQHSFKLLERFKLFREKLYYLPNSVNMHVFKSTVNSFSEREKLHIDKSGTLLLYVGNIMREIAKNPALLFRSFVLVRQKNNNLKLIVIGTKEQEAKAIMKKYCGEYSKEIIIVNTVKNDDLALYYSVSDLTILTSLYEGTPNVVLESLACGTPCVSTNVLDKGIIEDDINGYIVESFKPEDFAESILKGLALSEKLSKDYETKRSLLSSVYNLSSRRDNLLKIINT